MRCDDNRLDTTILLWAHRFGRLTASTCSHEEHFDSASAHDFPNGNYDFFLENYFDAFWNSENISISDSTISDYFIGSLIIANEYFYEFNKTAHQKYLPNIIFGLSNTLLMMLQRIADPDRFLPGLPIERSGEMSAALDFAKGAVISCCIVDRDFKVGSQNIISTTCAFACFSILRNSHSSQSAVELLDFVESMILNAEENIKITEELIRLGKTDSSRLPSDWVGGGEEDCSYRYLRYHANEYARMKKGLV